MDQDTPNTPNTLNMPGETAVPPTPVTPATSTVTQTEQAAPVEPVAPAESVTPVATSVEPAASSQRKGQWMLPVSIVCLVLGLGGVGFGVWAMINSNAQVGGLNAEIDSLRSQNEELTTKTAALTEQVEELSKNKSGGDQWGSTEVRDGVFYILDKDGNIIAQSDASGPVVSEIEACESSAENTVLKCTVKTAEGEGWFLYDVQGDGLETSFGAK